MHLPSLLEVLIPLALRKLDLLTFEGKVVLLLVGDELLDLTVESVAMES